MDLTMTAFDLGAGPDGGGRLLVFSGAGTKRGA